MNGARLRWEGEASAEPRRFAELGTRQRLTWNFLGSLDFSAVPHSDSSSAALVARLIRRFALPLDPFIGSTDQTCGWLDSQDERRRCAQVNLDRVAEFGAEPFIGVQCVDRAARL
jgi:hypothetical protein